MRMHPQLGYDLLRRLPAFSGAAGLVLAHHEAFDGSGYPRGLEGVVRFRSGRGFWRSPTPMTR